MSDWDRVVELYDELVDLSPDDRARRLAEREVPPGIASEVVSLLAFETQATSPLDRPVGRLEELATTVEREEADPERVGPYRVLCRIGAGGMGVVLLAERDDGVFEKQVAVKLIKRGMDSEALLERFRAERQILATLDDPAIARLLDGGICEDGRPYLVLEYIADGRPIDEYCRAESLDVRQRIELFLRACRAVHSAHQQLVLHRDLKPSNLLVSGDGELKLLDFGVAKLLTPEGTEATMTALRPMTPAYASPEQIAARPMGTYSDVYSLGVVLFELLTGSKPDGSAASTALTTHRRAGRRAWPAENLDEIRSRLRGDLDTIVAHCLAADPHQRYPSAEALAEDLERYLEKRPILARPPAVSYQIGKLVARNPVASGFALAALVAIGLGIGGVLWQSRVARAERDRATAEARKAGRLSDALIGLFDMADPVLAADAKTVSLRDVIERTEGDLAAGLADEPAVRAKMLAVLGRINTEFARYDVADRQLTEAVTILGDIYPDGHVDRAEALSYLSRLRGFQERRNEGRDLARRAVDMLRSLDAPGTLLADALERLATVSMNLNRVEEAEEAAVEALALRREALGPEHELVGKLVGSLAVIDYRRGRYAEAVERATRAVEIRKAAVGPVHQQVAHELNNLGAFLVAAGDRRRAREVHLEALAIRQEVFGPDHPYVAFSHGHLGEIARVEGDLASALESMRAALSIRQAAYPIDHSLVRISAASTADVLVDMGRAGEALRLLEPIIAAMGERIEVPGPRAQARLLVSYGRALIARGFPERALRYLDQAVELNERLFGAEDDRTIVSHVVRAGALLDAGEIDRAERETELALDQLHELGVPPLRLVEALELRARIHRERGDYQAAEAVERQRLAALTEALGADSPRVVEARFSLAASERSAGRQGREARSGGE